MSATQQPRGELVILSGSSGTGKTTVIRAMLETWPQDFGNLVFSVSHTTRPARRGEVDGKDYHFVDRRVFERMVSEDRFLEWAVVHGELKGTSREEVLPRLESGIDVLLDIDVQGGEQVMEHYPEAVSIFVLPPSYEVLESRLKGRGLDTNAQIRRRLAVSLWEMERYRRYQYVMINDDVERASRVLAAIILEKRHRLERMDGTVRAVLEKLPIDSFGPRSSRFRKPEE